MPNDLRHTPDTDERIRQLIHVGAEILGGTAGSLAETAIGFLVAGPAGAAIGGAGSTAISMVLRRVGADVTERLLSPREQARVGFVLTSAAAEIHSRNEQGEPLRTDGFFDPGNGDRSDAEEVAESVLLRSQREPEEKKLPYMAHLLANIAFDTKVNAYLAHQISKIAEQLTYRQFCILGLATIKDSFELRMVNYRDQNRFAKELHQILYEFQELHSKEYIHFAESDGFAGVTNIVPGRITLQGLGNDIYTLMGLSLIPRTDIAQIADQLG
ncbi:MAG: hypothetical protein OXG79_04565 [Chloroflexi bacterium]|nr:hypothetical protein [Chloroflexota bacterium]